MSNYGPQDEDAYTIFLEKTFLAGDFVTGVGYGVQLVLYVICARYLWSQRQRRGRISMFLLAYTTLLVLLESTFASVGARTVEDMYISNRNYPGGPWQYFLATQYLPENVIFYASFFTLTFLSDLLVLWRCWVIWMASGKIVATAVVTFPTLLLLASFALGTIWTLQSSQPGLSLYSSAPIAFGTAYYIISLSVNITVTILIIVRLVMHRRAIVQTLPEEHAKHYLSLATVVIESAALYSVFALIFIVSYAINNPINQIFLAVSSSCQQIAGYLIILRLAQGRAWSPATLGVNGTRMTEQLSTMRFGIANEQSVTLDMESQETPVSTSLFKQSGTGTDVGLSEKY
ncbi:hypothetical protein AMATHDRAFT_4555 [Amanita thiersii Skay4041]|uniref:G-protein coupled receptors family 1 profile domain-containing protein n=1 Tax=Amanita thiersii Skay4041 TaxID=703135 RepID=A0A2A9NPZ4_9AGAR|nr:hypothetical protein AMATHDRAFT_4555 [Amanita thiersii Skay4041]